MIQCSTCQGKGTISGMLEVIYDTPHMCTHCGGTGVCACGTCKILADLLPSSEGDKT